MFLDSDLNLEATIWRNSETLVEPGIWNSVVASVALSEVFRMSRTAHWHIVSLSSSTHTIPCNTFHTLLQTTAAAIIVKGSYINTVTHFTGGGGSGQYYIPHNYHTKFYWLSVTLVFIKTVIIKTPNEHIKWNLKV